MAKHTKQGIKARGLAFKTPNIKVSPGKRALTAPPKGVSKNVGPRSWKTIPMKVPNPPKRGSGGGPVILGVGSQTQRAQGPTVF